MNKLDWLPGVETYGEGIFITINNDKLNKWESRQRHYELGMEVAHRKLYKERDLPE